MIGMKRTGITRRSGSENYLPRAENHTWENYAGMNPVILRTGSPKLTFWVTEDGKVGMDGGAAESSLLTAAHDRTPFY